MNEDLGMPASQVQDIPLPKEDGLKQGRINPVCVEEIRNAASPCLDVLGVLGCNLVLIIRGLWADPIEIAKDSSHDSGQTKRVSRL